MGEIEPSPPSWARMNPAGKEAMSSQHSDKRAVKGEPGGVAGAGGVPEEGTAQEGQWLAGWGEDGRDSGAWTLLLEHPLLDTWQTAEVGVGPF